MSTPLETAALTYAADRYPTLKRQLDFLEAIIKAPPAEVPLTPHRIQVIQATMTMIERDIHTLMNNYVEHGHS